MISFVRSFKESAQVCVMLSCFNFSSLALSQNDGYEVFGKKTSLESIKQKDQSTFYDLEKKTYERVESLAQQAYLEALFSKKAAEQKISVDVFKESFFASSIKVSNEDVAKTIEAYKNEPELSKKPKDEQEKMVRQYLTQKAKGDVIEKLLIEAENSKNLVIHYPKPKEPVFSVAINSDDVPRYSSDGADHQAFGCEGDKCPITIVEFSEFQCPFCSRVMPQVKQILDEYKGKIRWVVKDFPLSFHDRARPAAIAAKCAAFQGKYWKMYSQLFAHQSELSDDRLKKHAQEIGLDVQKYDACIKDSKKATDLIDRNFKQGVEVGVTGTPAFFINGRRFSGAIPYSEFKKAIDEELKKKAS